MTKNELGLTRISAKRLALLHLRTAKKVLTNNDYNLAYHWLSAAANKWVMGTKLSVRPTDYQLQLRDHWSKCPSCGARNGEHYFPLEEHRPRCRYIGAANTRELTRPNYSKFLDEDDVRFLPFLRLQNEASKTKKSDGG